MYSLDEVNIALEKEQLSDALYKMERFAREQGLTVLSDWCHRELHGYDGSNQEEEIKNTEYRSIAVQWIDVLNRPIKVDPEISYVSTLPLWKGISELEGYAEKGTGYTFPSAQEMLSKWSTVPIQGAWLPPDQLQALLKRIRLQARMRLDDNVRRQPRSFPKSEVSSTQDWSRARRLLTFSASFTLIWSFLGPLFTIFGGTGPLAAWGVWRYPALLLFALVVTGLVELSSRRKSKN